MTEKRKSPRAPVFRNAYVIHKDGRVEHGRMMNIALPGVGIELRGPKRRGELLQLAFRLPLGSHYKEFIVDVVVVHCHLAHDIYYIGLSFKNLTQEQRHQINEYIYKKISSSR